jgi:hypothetical protein
MAFSTRTHTLIRKLDVALFLTPHFVLDFTNTNTLFNKSKMIHVFANFSYFNVAVSNVDLIVIRHSVIIEVMLLLAYSPKITCLFRNYVDSYYTMLYKIIPSNVWSYVYEQSSDDSDIN